MRRTRLLVCTFAGVLAVGASACVPLPIRHTEQVTASVIGTVRRSDGAPAAGLPVAVTASDEDSVCAGAGGAGVTDSAGRFRLPAVSVRRRILWLTWAESFGMTRYWFCARVLARAPLADSSVAPVQRTVVYGWVHGDTLACLEWTWRSATRVTCNGSIGQRRILTGGAWRDGQTVGTYRVLLPDEEGWAARAVVQWITTGPPGGDASDSVHAQTELPTGKAIFP